MSIGTEKGFDFDDLLLIPRASSLISRTDVDLTTKLGDTLTLQMPIIASPMKGIVGEKLVVELAKLGSIGIMHRFYKDEDSWNRTLLQIRNDTDSQFGVAVSTLINKRDMEFILNRFNPKIICLDTANGYLDTVLAITHVIKNLIIKGGYQSKLMVGNIVTYLGAKSLHDSGADLIRVGIGSGQLCTTRNNTGVGYPQLSAIRGCAGYYEAVYHGVSMEKRQDINWKIVADGGIRNSGDAVKALAMGADAIMIGSLFGKCFESANNGIIYGMASRKLQEEYYHSVKSVEGIEKKLVPDISLKDFIDEFTFNIRSACTYLNVHKLHNLRDKASWVETGKGTIK